MKHNISTGALHVSGIKLPSFSISELNSKGQTADKRDWIEQGRKQGMVQGLALAVKMEWMSMIWKLWTSMNQYWINR